MSDLESITAAELVPRKLVVLRDYATIQNHVMSGFKFVNSEDHDEALDGAVFIHGCIFTDCDFSELRSYRFESNLLNNCIAPPVEIWAEVSI